MGINFLKLWKVVDTLNTVAQATKAVRRSTAGPAPSDDLPSGFGGTVGQLEARLAGVVVAALKEAFDRDRARTDFERSHLDAERQRAEAALRLEYLKQVGDRALTEMRLIMGLDVAVWLVSALLVAWLPAVRELAPKLLLGGGWLALIGSLACASVAQNHVVGWLATAAQSSAVPSQGTAPLAARWLFLAALALVALSLLIAL
jgi:hypothetical protein